MSDGEMSTRVRRGQTLLKIPERYARLFRAFLVVSLLGVGMYVLNGQRSELTGAISILQSAKIGPILLAILAESGSVFAFGIFSYILLRVSLERIGFLLPVGISFAATTINNSVPGGAAVSSIYSFREYRALGAEPAFAAWVLVALNILSGVSLAALAGLGVALSFQVSQGLDLFVVVALIAVALVALSAAVSTPMIVVSVTRSILRASFKIIRLPRGGAREIDRICGEFSAAKPKLSQIVLAVTFALLNWVFDAAVLVLAYIAIGKSIPWSGLLLAYGAGQLAANLPITPGGLGVVEGSLSIALIAYGGAQESAVAAVLIYRLISYWFTMPFGWVVYIATSFVRRSQIARSDDLGEDNREVRDENA